MGFTPYVFFSGDCAEAFDRYREIFGGDLQVMRSADAPADPAMPPGDFVMHASLTLDDGALLYGSDDPTGDGGPKVGFAVSHSPADLESAHRVFDALADGGQVTMALAETFFSPGFGMCVDRFGVPWMIDVAQPAE